MKGFHRVALKPKVFTRKFKTATEVQTSVTFTRTGINVPSITPVKIYNIGNDEYAFCADEKVRKRVGSGFQETGFNTHATPLLLPIILNGQKKLMIVSDRTAYIDGTTVTGVPYGNAGIYFGGRLFIADGSVLKYSAEFDFTDFSVGLEEGGFIETDAYSGEIIYLFADDEKLYIVCRHAIYTLKPFGKPYEFKMEKFVTGLDIAENSVSSFGETLNFISGKGLYRLSGGKVKRVGNGLKVFDTVTVLGAGDNDGLYIANVFTGTEHYIYAFDNRTDKEYRQLFTGYTIAGKYAKRLNEDKLYVIELKDNTVTTGEQYYGTYDFGTCRKKAIVRVEAHVNGRCRINVRGDGLFRAMLTDKCNSVSCFLHGTEFSVSFDAYGENFTADRLTLYYVVYGE